MLLWLAIVALFSAAGYFDVLTKLLGWLAISPANGLDLVGALAATYLGATSCVSTHSILANLSVRAVLVFKTRVGVICGTWGNSSFPVAAALTVEPATSDDVGEYQDEGKGLSVAIWRWWWWSWLVA